MAALPLQAASPEVTYQGVLPPNVAELRSTFEEAERKAPNANEMEFAALHREFSQYPLWPYLEARWLQNNLSVDNEALILSFLQRYYGTSPERSVRHAWLNYLARRNDRSRYIRDFVDRGDGQQVCRYLNYRLREEGPSEALWPLIERRWLQASSQHRLCDPVFNAWQEAGERSEALIWQRFELALDAANWSMARYLRSLMTEHEQGLADQFLRIRQRPARLSEYSNLPADDERAQMLALNSLRRYVWQDQSRALRLWPGMQQHFEFDESTVSEMNAAIGVVLAVRGDEHARDWFELVAADDLSESAQHWYLTVLLQAGDFEGVLQLTREGMQNMQARYWQARALEALERPVEAQPVWEALAENRNYYGFMAATHLGQALPIGHQPVVIEPERIRELMSDAGIQRSYELFRLGRFFDARREWNLVRPRLSDDERAAAAVLAYHWQWFDQGIREFAQLGLTSDIEKRFPIGFQRNLEHYAKQHSVDPAWAYAIIRRESAFQSDAISPVGARGLMQIMPDTAEYLSRNNPGPGGRRTPDLYHPEDNIRLGTQYLADLLRRTRDNWLFATASYNAGYYRVREWAPDEATPADIWIESIPFQETRDYVKAVLTYQQIYKHLLGQGDNVLQHMHSMRIHPDGGICGDGQTELGITALC